MFICFGAALFTVLSRGLAAEPSDYTRIAAQIIPGIGFIGAGSILHTRGLTSGLTTAATIFVVASIGMAAGGGLYLTAFFATALVLGSLFFLGYAEENFNIKLLLCSYEVTGASVEEISHEVNRILETHHRLMQNVISGNTGQHVRLQFDVEGCSREQKELLRHVESLDRSPECLLPRTGGARVKPGVRTIPFVKASACGNDFLLIDAALAPSDIAAFTRRICDRHDGVGADGVEWMTPHFSADLEIRLINADGSPAEISGNGTRCVAAYVCATQGKERVSDPDWSGTQGLRSNRATRLGIRIRNRNGKSHGRTRTGLENQFRRSAWHSCVDGQSALCHHRFGIHAQLAIASGRDPKAAAISGWRERRVRCSG